MTTDQYKTAIMRIGFDHESAAQWLGVSARTAYRYATGKVRIPGPVAKLLRLVIKLGLDPSEVR